MCIRDSFNYAVHLFRWFSYRQPSDRISIQIQFPNLTHMPDAKIFIGTSLVDPPKHLFWIDCIWQSIQPIVLRLTTV